MSDSTRRFHRPTNPHFFQPLIPGFETNFSIPKSFRKYVDMVGQEGNRIAITLRDKRGKIWKVKVVQGDDYRQCFKEGWEEFCKDNALQVGDILVFRHQGNLVFDVFIFDPPTACERGFPFLDPREKIEVSSSKFLSNVTASAVSSGKASKREVPGFNSRAQVKAFPGDSIATNGKGYKWMEGKEDCINQRLSFKPTRYPYCHMVVKAYWLRSSALYLPGNFAREHGLTKRNCDIEVVDNKGKSWSLVLSHHDGNPSYIRRWRTFHQANALKPGDPVILELICSGETPVIKFYS